MNKYKIKYQWGFDILIAEIKAESITQAEYLFQMQYGPGIPIESIEEVIDETVT